MLAGALSFPRRLSCLQTNKHKVDRDEGFLLEAHNGERASGIINPVISAQERWAGRAKGVRDGSAGHSCGSLASSLPPFAAWGGMQRWLLLVTLVGGHSRAWSTPCPLLAVRPSATSSLSLCLRFLTYKMGPGTGSSLSWQNLSLQPQWFPQDQPGE